MESQTAYLYDLDKSGIVARHDTASLITEDHRLSGGVNNNGGRFHPNVPCTVMMWLDYGGYHQQHQDIGWWQVDRYRARLSPKKKKKQKDRQGAPTPRLPNFASLI